MLKEYGDFSTVIRDIFEIYKPPTHWYFAGIQPLTVESPMEIFHSDVRHEFQSECYCKLDFVGEAGLRTQNPLASNPFTEIQSVLLLESNCAKSELNIKWVTCYLELVILFVGCMYVVKVKCNANYTLWFVQHVMFLGLVKHDLTWN